MLLHLSQSVLKRNRQTTTHAFTLVELLVVIGIIAVLVSILLPALNKVRQQAAAVACMSNMKQVGTALAMYRNANKDFAVPLARYYSGSWTTLPGYPQRERDMRWFNYLQRYTRTYKVFNCPTMNEQVGWNGQPGTNTMVKSLDAEAGPPTWVVVGYSGVGVTSNYAWVRSVMGTCMEPAVDADGGASTTFTAAPSAAHWPRKFANISGACKMAGTTLNDTIIAMDGVYYIAAYATTPTPAGYDVTFTRRYMHVGKRSNVLLGDGRVESIRVDETKAATGQVYGSNVGIYYKKS
jgi:prepilin-type N-terminal cleavage/methylation domain-containing protein